MKKGLIFAALALVVVLFGSCTRFKNASVDVLVRNAAGDAVKGQAVGMFDAQTKIADAKYGDAILTGATGLDGIAEFEITTVQFKLEKSATFYFVVFDNADFETQLGKSDLVSVKAGGNHNVEIRIP